MNRINIVWAQLLLCAVSLAQSPERAAHVYFSPEADAQKAIITSIASASKSIHMQASIFTARAVVRALIDAQRRGIEVKLCLGRKTLKDKRCGAKRCASAGIKIWIRDSHPLVRDTVIIVDSLVVIVGSDQLCGSAKRNSENCLIIHDPSLAEDYERNWDARKLYCKPYK